ncbi:imidazole glycerol phosphate synthase subunit HisH [Ectothiorhodospiraceae bacterium 2226]|nr:imidazole glycerol phosphate synthase subunit HisH [Ectothiorhodospiraceae bacterium 2226]
MSTVAVIDYGMGNLHSVAKALEHAGVDGVQVAVTDDPRIIRSAERVVLPGVGAMRDCMAELQARGLTDVVREVAADRPFLGVCVGMQALMQRSAENNGVECLGVLPGAVEYFGDALVDPVSGERLKVPHMGWNEVQQTMAHPLWKGIPPGARFYFVHSYFVQPAGPELVAGSAHHGFPFAAALARGNLFAVQFHPEKSQHVGLRLYANFLSWNGRL